ncbi:hypothetical protein GS540_29800 [Rhodococcus hoagii]|nr:hypothetical protein [Prescottella equi]
MSVPADAATGASVTLTANVAPANATGTVQFTANGVDIGSPAPVSNGVATLQHTFTTAGVQAIGACSRVTPDSPAPLRRRRKPSL